MTEIDNALSEYLFALRKDTPGKVWWDADVGRAPIYRQLRIDPADASAAYAVVPFRVARIDGSHVILAAHPTPNTLDPEPDWLAIETVIAWNPIDDTAKVLGDVEDQLVGRLTEEANTIFASPRAFFQAWAIRRATFLGRLRATQGRHWHIAASEADEVPGALLIGDIAKVRMRPSAMPAHIECDGLDPRELNRAIMRAARLPRATSANSTRRAA